MKPPWICYACQHGHCEKCSDVMRVVLNKAPECHCKARSHSGEPIDNQILDPYTGIIHAPGLTVTKDGEVKKND